MPRGAPQADLFATSDEVDDAGELQHASVPSGWRRLRVDEAGRVTLGRQRAPQHERGRHMRPYLRVANVYENRIDTSDVLRMNFEPEEIAVYELRAGDILLNEGQSPELVGRRQSIVTKCQEPVFRTHSSAFEPVAT